MNANTKSPAYPPFSHLQYIERVGKVPEIAHYQLDNTCRENKNQYTLAFAMWAVHLGLAKEMHLKFMPVG